MKLRTLIEQHEILVMPGVFDGFSAHLVERAGFPTAFVTGAGISESRWGLPDIGLIGFHESLEAADVIASSTSLMLIGDADTGYGNAVNAYRTVREFERAGLSGVMIEDQTWPKRCGHMSGKSVISAEEMVQKIRASCDARRDHDFIIKARTDAAAIGGVEEAIRRGNLYAQAGADLVFADALRSEGEIRRFAAGVHAPVAVNMGFGLRERATTPLISAQTLESFGVAVVIYPRLLTSAAARGMQVALSALTGMADSTSTRLRPELQLSFEELNDLVGLPAFEELERRYSE